MTPLKALMSAVTDVTTVDRRRAVGDQDVEVLLFDRFDRLGGPRSAAITRGRLSNPVQRRLPSTEIDALVGLYRDGSSMDVLARKYRLHRTTVIHHLEQAGIARRRVVRKMNDESVTLAAARYEQGASLAVVTGEFGVHQRNLARESSLGRERVSSRRRSSAVAGLNADETSVSSTNRAVLRDRSRSSP